MKLLGVFLSFLMLFGCSGSNVNIQRSDMDQDILRNALQSTVVIVANRNESNEESIAAVECSGFFVAPRVLVSALHCFQRIIRIQLRDGVLQLPTRPDPTGDVIQFVRYDEIDHMSRRYLVDVINEATVVRIDADRDIAILNLNPGTQDSVRFLTLSNRIPDVTERVYLIGHPLEMVWTVGDGIVSRNVIVGEQLSYIQTNIGLVGGYSGGPMLDINGNVLGMANYFVGQMHHLSLFVSAQRISNLLIN